METALLGKVGLLLTLSLLSGAAGSWFGRNLRSWAALIVLAVAFIGGIFVLAAVAAAASPMAAIITLLIWVFISGLFSGPVLNMYVKDLGATTVTGAFLGTAGVMAATGLIGLFSGINFAPMGSFLMIGLLGLILVGIIGIFFRMSRTTNIIYSLFGMVIFAGYFLFDFFRLGHTENTWGKAVMLTASLYLDFMNFFINFMSLLSSIKHK